MSRKTWKTTKQVVGLGLCLVNVGLCLGGLWMLGASLQCLATCLVFDLIF